MGALSDSLKVMRHFEVVKEMVPVDDLFQQAVQLRNIPLSVAELVDEPTFRLVGLHQERLVEGRIRPQDAQARVQFDERVYNAPVSGLVSVLREVPVEKTKVLLIGHNPGCVDLVLSLSAGGDPVALGDVETKYPTAGIAEIAISGQWHDLAAGCGELRRFVVPRG